MTRGEGAADVQRTEHVGLDRLLSAAKSLNPPTTSTSRPRARRASYNLHAMTDFGKLLIFLGIALAVVGGLIYLLARTGFRGLPGDISYQSPHVRFYFPIVTCLVLSAILTLVMWLWRWLSGR